MPQRWMCRSSSPRSIRRNRSLSKSKPVSSRSSTTSPRCDSSTMRWRPSTRTTSSSRSSTTVCSSSWAASPPAVTRVVVEAERYESENSHEKFGVRVTRSGETWTATLDATTVRDEYVRAFHFVPPPLPGARAVPGPCGRSSSPARSRARWRAAAASSLACWPASRGGFDAAVCFFLTATSSFRYRGGCEPVEIVDRSRSEKSTGGTRHCQVLQCR